MELHDYIEEIEPILSKDEGYSVLRCVIQFSKLLLEVMPQSGRKGIEICEQFLKHEANEKDMEAIRVEIWKDYENNYKNTSKGEALRTIICALYYPISEDEYFDTITYAIDFCQNSMPLLNDSVFKDIIKNEYQA